MVQVTVSVDSDGAIRELEAEGHAEGFEKGSNPVCAAATVLVRTYLRWLESGGVEPVEGKAPEPGVLYARIGRPDRDRRALVEGASGFLLTGLADLQEMFPRQCSLRVLRFKE